MGIYELKKPKRINAFSVTLFLVVTVVGGGIYWFVPLWWPVFQTTGIMHGICNDMYRELRNEVLMEKLLKETVRTGLHLTPDNFKMERIPYTPDELRARNQERESVTAVRGKECRLTLNYVSEGDIPVIDKHFSIPWSRTITQDLRTIKY